MLHIGVDVGGTKIFAAEVQPTGRRVGRTALHAMPGREVAEQVLDDAVTAAVEEVAGGRTVSGVGISAAGLVDARGEVVRFATHLPWRGSAVRARLAARWGVPVVLDNDANCAAHAELAHGVARGVGSALLVTIGTGIGGAVIVDGRVQRGAGGLAGEFGHMCVQPGGRQCPCGLAGCWEEYCSGRALERVAREADGERREGRDITRAARDGDPDALACFAVVGGWLGRGVASLVSALDPAVVVVGGGVSSAGDLLLDPARDAMASLVHGAAHRSMPPLVQARFGADAGAVGAAWLAREAG